MLSRRQHRGWSRWLNDLRVEVHEPEDADRATSVVESNRVELSRAAFPTAEEEDSHIAGGSRAACDLPRELLSDLPTRLVRHHFRIVVASSITECLDRSDVQPPDLAVTAKDEGRHGYLAESCTGIDWQTAELLGEILGQG